MAVYQTLTIKEISVDTLANTSRVQILWKSQQTGESHNLNTRTAKYWITINGTKTEYSVSYTLPLKTTQTILSKTITVAHKENGTGTVSVQTWMDTRISAGEVELSKSLTLTSIPRASTVGAGDAFVESTAIIAVSRKSKAYTHSIAFSFGNLTGFIDADGGITQTETKHSATNIPFAIPVSFYDQMRDTKSLKCKLTCRTYQGNVQIGSAQTSNFTVTAKEELCAPLVSGSVRDSNSKTLELTGDENVLVRHHSSAFCEIQAQPRNGATIVTRKVCGVVSEGTLAITNVTSGDFSFSAQDSRGFAAVQSVTKTMIPYVPITLNAKVIRTDPTSGNAVLEVSGQCYMGKFGAKANELSLKYSVNGSADVTVPVTVNDDGLGYTASAEITNLDYMNTHTVEITLTDVLEKVVRTVTVKPGVPVFDWGEKDFAFHVPVSMGGQLITDVKKPKNDTDAVNKAYADGKISICKLWVNDQPTENFTEQTIQMPFSSGEMALVFFAEGIDANSLCSAIVPYGKSVRVLGKYGDYLTHRRVRVQENGVTIYEGNRMLEFGQWSVADKVLIPVFVCKIIGMTDLTNMSDASAICGTFLCGEVFAGQ